ncbi:hypothetical protein [Streptomyces sp. NPDC055056]
MTLGDGAWLVTALVEAGMHQAVGGLEVLCRSAPRFSPACVGAALRLPAREQAIFWRHALTQAEQW